MSKTTLDRISDGRTDLVFDYCSAGNAANSADGNGVSLISWCAYYGDVSAIRFLLANGESLGSLGENLDLNGDSPLTWASWHLRPAAVLRKLCYGGFRVRPDYAGMDANLLGKAHV